MTDDEADDITAAALSARRSPADAVAPDAPSSLSSVLAALLADHARMAVRLASLEGEIELKDRLIARLLDGYAQLEGKTVHEISTLFTQPARRRVRRDAFGRARAALLRAE